MVHNAAKLLPIELRAYFGCLRDSYYRWRDFVVTVIRETVGANSESDDESMEIIRTSQLCLDGRVS